MRLKMQYFRSNVLHRLFLHYSTVHSISFALTFRVRNLRVIICYCCYIPVRNKKIYLAHFVIVKNHSTETHVMHNLCQKLLVLIYET
jgi:hypothetical protein